VISIEQPPIPLSADVFKQLRDMMYEHCGVWLDEQSKFFVEGRLQESLRRHRFGSFKDLYYFLKYDSRRAEEFATIVDLLTIHETYFFREDHQLHALQREILPELMKHRQDRTLRIWSAGCSTGEEPYTVSMLLLEKEELKDWTIEIFATDISQRVLQSARRGLYQPTAFRSTDPKYVSKYFTKEESAFRITDAVKRNVIFLHLNLMDTNKIAFINPMDIIFCRNVIIYFDLASKRKVINLFHAKLKDNGYLLLGHSESLINISTAFALRHLKHDMVYQKLERTSGTSG
jgi:chemotaxis protein methyltransferase CheR